MGTRSPVVGDRGSEIKAPAELVRGFYTVGMGTWVHRLTSINPDELTGECMVCGSVQLRRRAPRHAGGPTRYSCLNIERQGDQRRNKQRLPTPGRRANISYSDALAMIEAQAGRCQICGSTTRIVIDHCHATKRVRGVLCHHCNIGLGGFRDNPEWMLRAIEYLKVGDRVSAFQEVPY